ncbi:DNA topoisomerase 1 [Borealophlyctis nickersoniae]|nr:DNA topoisomerase 1 [Borealophlyctis nickersoniae]
MMSDSEDDIPLKARRGKTVDFSEPLPLSSNDSSNGDEDLDYDDIESNDEVEVRADSDTDSDLPLFRARKKSRKIPFGRKRAKVDTSSFSEGSESDVPLAKKKKLTMTTFLQERRKVFPAAVAFVRPCILMSLPTLNKETANSDDSRKAVKNKTAKNKGKNPEQEAGSVDVEDFLFDLTFFVNKKTADNDDSDDPRKAVKNKKAKKKGKKPEQEAGSADEEGEQGEAEYQWWLEQNGQDSTIKWTTLEHNGPYFAPAYEAHGVKMLYDGKEIELHKDAEEVATFFAAVLGTPWAENPTFQKNFFADFQKVIAESKKSPRIAGTLKPVHIKTFSKCDFTPIADYLAREKEKRKTMTPEEKKRAKEEKAQLDATYGWAYLDGRKEKVGNFRIEPPGLFRGRGEHPKTGSLKRRVVPEQVTINCGGGLAPEPPKGHDWGKVIMDNKVTWLAMWKENVNDSIKYVFLAANSSLKGQSDLKKFEKARTLKLHVDQIREDYMQDLSHKEMVVRQIATALYFIDRLALRAGNEKGDDEADTVGCCSLRVEHITLKAPNTVIFDFLGKDSIRYYNEVEVSEKVYKNLKLFSKPPKDKDDTLFDRLTTSSVNKTLTRKMPGLTAKVFRTYNASWTFQEELKKTPENATVQEKILHYNRANRAVAVLCNHQRAVSKSHPTQIKRIKDKINQLKYECRKVKYDIIDLDPARKRSKKVMEVESDLDEEWVENYEKELAEKDAEKLAAKNEKRRKEGKTPLDRLPERKTPRTVEKLLTKLDTLKEKIQVQEMLLTDKDENKTTALSTSKINYIDPRISAAWCYKYGVPIEKIFNQSLRDKFKWALEVKGDWEF